MAPVILPTHSCFDDALDFLAERVRDDPRLAYQRTLLLVHAIVLFPDDGQHGPHAGEPFAHAWCEQEFPRAVPLCWSGGLLDGQRIWFAAERDEFYRELRVQQTTKYTIRDAWRENARSGTYGPWEPAYGRLCGRT